MEIRQPLPPFTLETATLKVRIARCLEQPRSGKSFIGLYHRHVLAQPR